MIKFKKKKYDPPIKIHLLEMLIPPLFHYRNL